MFRQRRVFVPCARSHRGVFRANLGSPVYLKQECLRRFAAKTFCVWRFTPNTGGFAALATINDGASLLIEGEKFRAPPVEDEARNFDPYTGEAGNALNLSKVLRCGAIKVIIKDNKNICCGRML